MLTVTLDEDGTFAERLDYWFASLSDLRWAWPKVVPDIAGVHEQMFDDEGPGWAPLANMTANMREVREGYYRRGSQEDAYHRILHWTHSLRNSLASDGGNRFSHRVFLPTKMHYGTEFPPGKELNTYRPFLRPNESVAIVAERFATLLPNRLNASRGA